MRPLLFFITYGVLSLFPRCSHAASRLSASTADSDLNLQRTHVAWPAPSEMAEELVSKDDSVRLRAMLLFGLSDQQARGFTSSSPTLRHTIRPDLVRLNYAALGTGPDTQAVLAFQADQMVFVAVATATKAGWSRIAFSNMWSKYDLDNGDALFQAVRLSAAPGNPTISSAAFELILRSSGGGTGVYEQQEAHFRVYEGELRNVFSFISDQRRCDPSPEVQACKLNRSWLVLGTTDSKRGVVLVEEGGTLKTVHQPDVLFALRDLQNRYLRPSSCAFYEWDDHNFDYKLRPGSPAICRARAGQ